MVRRVPLVQLVLPVSIIDTFNLSGGVTTLDVARYSALTLPILNFIIPFVLVFIVDGMKGIKEILPVILTVEWYIYWITIIINNIPWSRTSRHYSITSNNGGVSICLS